MVLEQRLSVGIHRILAELLQTLKQTRAEKPYRTPKDSDRASTPELRGELLIGWEALRPSEPRHSPDKAMPSYYTKNESFAIGISKVAYVF
jgi:hypothetical protein